MGNHMGIKRESKTLKISICFFPFVFPYDLPYESKKIPESFDPGMSSAPKADKKLVSQPTNPKEQWKCHQQPPKNSVNHLFHLSLYTFRAGAATNF